MQQMNNIIRIDEGGVSTPYVVLEHISYFASPPPKDGYRYIKGFIPHPVHFVCVLIEDAVWEYVPEQLELEFKYDVIEDAVLFE